MEENRVHNWEAVESLGTVVSMTESLLAKKSHLETQVAVCTWKCELCTDKDNFLVFAYCGVGCGANDCALVRTFT